MVKLSRYILVLIGIMAASIAIPQIYWTIFREAPSVPNVVYSRVLDEFMMVAREDGVLVRKDEHGNIYSRDEFEAKLPLLFFRQLFATGDMPDTIKGRHMDHAELSTYSSNFTLRPVDMNTPEPVLLPLLEAQSGRVSLALPEDFFRLSDRIEFIVAETNRVDREKSDKFNEALIREGFAFPARLTGGLPTDRKNEEEGYFIKDNNGDLFHLMMIRGEPYVARIDIPAQMEIVHIECVDIATREYYAFLFSEGNEIYLLMQDGYQLQKLPADGYDPKNHRLRVREDVLHKTISIIGDDHLQVTVVDDKYEVVDTYSHQWDPLHLQADHILFGWLFPFQLNLQVPESRFVTLNIFRSPHYFWMLTNLVLVGVSVGLLKRKNRCFKKNLIDLGIVLLTGVFGFIATRVFPNRFFD